VYDIRYICLFSTEEDIPKIALYLVNGTEGNTDSHSDYGKACLMRNHGSFEGDFICSEF
jgi:hypothetical protein